MSVPDGTTEGPDGATQEATEEAVAEETNEVYPDWMSQGPDRHKTNEAFKGFKTIGDLQDSYLETKTKHDENAEAMKTMVKFPTGDTADEDIQVFYNSLGRPETVDGYALEDPDLPAGLLKDEELSKRFKAVSHKIGLTNPQAEELYAFYNDTMVEAFNKNVEAKKAQNDAAIEDHEKVLGDVIENLKKEWGSEYNSNIVHMNRAMQQFGGEGFIQLMKDTQIGNNIEFMKTFVNIGKTMGESTLIPGMPATTKVSTEEEVLTERYKSMKDTYPTYRQKIVPTIEPSEDMKKRYPKMVNLFNK